MTSGKTDMATPSEPTFQSTDTPVGINQAASTSMSDIRIAPAESDIDDNYQPLSKEVYVLQILMSI